MAVVIDQVWIQIEWTASFFKVFASVSLKAFRRLISKRFRKKETRNQVTKVISFRARPHYRFLVHLCNLECVRRSPRLMRSGYHHPQRKLMRQVCPGFSNIYMFQNDSKRDNTISPFVAVRCNTLWCESCRTTTAIKRRDVQPSSRMNSVYMTAHRVFIQTFPSHCLT